MGETIGRMVVCLFTAILVMSNLATMEAHYGLVFVDEPVPKHRVLLLNQDPQLQLKGIVDLHLNPSKSNLLKPLGEVVNGYRAASFLHYTQQSMGKPKFYRQFKYLHPYCHHLNRVNPSFEVQHPSSIASSWPAITHGPLCKMESLSSSILNQNSKWSSTKENNSTSSGSLLWS